LFHVRFEGKTPAGLMALHVAFLAGAGLLLLHALASVLLYLMARFPEKGMDRCALRKAWILSVAALGSFFLGAIPLGVLVSHAVLGTGFECWPFGSNAAHTATGIALLAWAGILAWRLDLVRARGDPRPAADVVFAILFLVGLGAGAAALLVSHAAMLS
jgi:hypothetical protein